MTPPEPVTLDRPARPEGTFAKVAMRQDGDLRQARLDGVVVLRLREIVDRYGRSWTEAG